MWWSNQLKKRYWVLHWVCVHTTWNGWICYNIDEKDTNIGIIRYILFHSHVWRGKLAPHWSKVQYFSSSVKWITSIPTLIHQMINTVKISYITNKKHHKCMPDPLAQKCTIGRKTTANKITATTQLSVQSAIVPLTKRYHTAILKHNL